MTRSLQSMIDKAKIDLHKIFVLSKEEDRLDLFDNLLKELYRDIKNNKLMAPEKIRPTVEQKKEFIHKLAGMTFYELEGGKGAYYTVTEDGKFQTPDGIIKKSPSGAIEHQLNQNFKPGRRGRTFSGWYAKNLNGETAEECILKYVIKG